MSKISDFFKITIGSCKFVHLFFSWLYKYRPYCAHMKQYLPADLNILAHGMCFVNASFTLPTFVLMTVAYLQSDSLTGHNNCLKLSYPRLLSRMRTRTQMTPILSD